jgi:hypothetical protein
MILMFDAERYNFYRGFSAMRGGSNNLRDLGDILNFTKTKEKVGAALAAVIQQNGPLDEDEWGGVGGAGAGAGDDDDDTTPGAVGEKNKDNPKITLAQLFGGDIPVIQGELKQFLTQPSGANIIEFIEYLAGLFVAGLDVPPAYFLDEKLTGPNVRSVQGKAQKKFNNRAWMMAQFVRFCWLRVIAHGIANGELPVSAGWDRIGYQFPPLVTIDLGDAMSNERADVLCGQMSEKRRFGNQGLDSDREGEQIERELRQKLQRAMKLSAEFPKIPMEVILTRLGLGNLTLSEGAAAAATETKTNAAKQTEAPPKEEKK